MNSMHTRSLITLSIFIIASSSASAQDEEPGPITPAELTLDRPVEYAADVAPILEANCVACHNKQTSESDVILESATAIHAGVEDKPLIVAGKPDESLLYRVAARMDEPQMPPIGNDVQANVLTPAQVAILRQWIVEGAKGGDSASATQLAWQALPPELRGVYATDIDASGRYVAAGRGNRITVYDLVTGNEVSQLRDPALAPDGPPVAQRDFVHALEFHPNGELLASGGYRTVRLWQRNSSAATAFAPEAGSAALEFSPTAQRVVIRREDGTLLCGNVFGDGNATLVPAAIQPAVPEGQTIRQAIPFGADGSLTAAILGETTLAIWNAEQPEAVAQLVLEAPVHSITSIPGTSQFVAVEKDSDLALYEFQPAEKTLTAKHRVTVEGGQPQSIVASPTTIGCVVAQKAMTFLVAELKQQPAYDAPAAILNIALSADGTRLAVASEGQTTVLVNTADAKPVATLTNDYSAWIAHQRATALDAIAKARAAHFKARAEAIAKEVEQQKEAATKAVEALEAAKKALAEAEEAKKPTAAALADANEKLKADAENAELKTQVEAAQKADTDAGNVVTAKQAELKSATTGDTIAKQSVERAEVRLTESQADQTAADEKATAAAASLTEATAAKDQPKTSKTVAFTANGKIVVTLADDGVLRFWNAASGTPLESRSVAETAAGATVRADDNTVYLTSLTGIQAVPTEPDWVLSGILGPQESPDNISDSVFVDRVLSLAFNPDGSLLATGGGEASRSGQIILWNIADRSIARELVEPHSDTVYGLEFSFDGSLLLSGAADKFAKVFNVGTGEFVRSYEGHTHHVMDVSWKADATSLATAGADNAIKIWNFETGEQQRTIGGYSKQVTALSYVGQGDTLLSSSADQKVQFHTSGDGKNTRNFGGLADYIYSVAGTPDGSLVAAGAEDGTLKVWNGNDGQEIASFAPVQ